MLVLYIAMMQSNLAVSAKVREVNDMSNGDGCSVVTSPKETVSQFLFLRSGFRRRSQFVIFPEWRQQFEASERLGRIRKTDSPLPAFRFSRLVSTIIKGAKNKAIPGDASSHGFWPSSLACARAAW